MATRAPFSVGEWYHCYNRGVDKRKVFIDQKDYERFLISMHVGNSDEHVHISNLKNKKLKDLMDDVLFNKGSSIVEIGAYVLMPNHNHFVLKEIQEGGIALFMQKIFTGYTMYFNKKYERTGSLFAGSFKSKHVPDDRYLKWLIAYVHFNPIEIIEPRWKEGQGDLLKIKDFLKKYSYSSLPGFLLPTHPRRQILGKEIFDLYESIPKIEEMLDDAQKYYQEYIKVKP